MTRTFLFGVTAFAAALSLAACNQPQEPAAAPGDAPAAEEAAAPAGPEAAAPAGALPADVAALQEKFELCEHFSGEDPYDDARRDQINTAIAANCQPVREAIPTIKAQYADDPAVMALVKTWEELLG